MVKGVVDFGVKIGVGEEWPLTVFFIAVCLPLLLHLGNCLDIFGLEVDSRVIHRLLSAMNR